MKDKLIKALTTEYEAVYLINLEEDTFETLKKLKGSAAMLSSHRWSIAGRAFAEECSDDSKTIIKLFSDPLVLKASLTGSDVQECTFRHITSDARWRKAVAQVIERKEKTPLLVLLTVSMIDKLTYQKEKMLHELLSVKKAYGKQAEGENSNDLSVYKMILSGESENDGHKLFVGIKILLVEDNEILRLISKEILENEGAAVTMAENGQKAVDIVTSGKRFDFIIMDIVMPVLDGISATSLIMDYQQNKEIKTPILGLTADGSREQIQKIIEAGAYACLSKPLNPKEMSKVFISYMKEKSMLMEEKIAEINLLANTDMLTQTGNIVAYTRDIGSLSQSLCDLTTNIAIVMCDLDDLKGINDTYGHDIGDIYIKNCCNLISGVFGNSALYRVGGDEFALILKGDELSSIDEWMVELDDQSKRLSAIEEVVDGKASVSSGYAIYDPVVDQSLSDTRKRADMAMYENKQTHKKWRGMYSKPR